MCFPICAKRGNRNILICLQGVAPEEELIHMSYNWNISYKLHYNIDIVSHLEKEEEEEEEKEKEENKVKSERSEILYYRREMFDMRVHISSGVWIDQVTVHHPEHRIFAQALQSAQLVHHIPHLQAILGYTGLRNTYLLCDTVHYAVKIINSSEYVAVITSKEYDGDGPDETDEREKDISREGCEDESYGDTCEIISYSENVSNLCVHIPCRGSRLLIIEEKLSQVKKRAVPMKIQHQENTSNHMLPNILKTLQWRIREQQKLRRGDVIGRPGLWQDILHGDRSLPVAPFHLSVSLPSAVSANHSNNAYSFDVKCSVFYEFQINISTEDLSLPDGIGVKTPVEKERAGTSAEMCTVEVMVVVLPYHKSSFASNHLSEKSISQSNTESDKPLPSSNEFSRSYAHNTEVVIVGHTRKILTLHRDQSTEQTKREEQDTVTNMTFNTSHEDCNHANIRNNLDNRGDNPCNSATHTLKMFFTQANTYAVYVFVRPVSNDRIDTNHPLGHTQYRGAEDREVSGTGDW
eukprot:CAMPEP_0182439452 /NCGR_PEP_ID=MMETSP1167-20130531/86451_1 /TAXON_ID=2988 /ORGANISM="Mallomonas Sp, Strain CCMP3275" /LENGTH=520 /DNA_ID=CAMNT_0024633167 /DNA_START=308 /DNA_END=1867 /DNA_ORIENTATION=+